MIDSGVIVLREAGGFVTKVGRSWHRERVVRAAAVQGVYFDVQALEITVSQDWVATNGWRIVGEKAELCLSRFGWQNRLEMAQKTLKSVCVRPCVTLAKCSPLKYQQIAGLWKISNSSYSKEILRSNRVCTGILKGLCGIYWSCGDLEGSGTNQWSNMRFAKSFSLFMLFEFASYHDSEAG